MSLPVLHYLPIDLTAIPYRFSVRLAGVTFILELHHNAEGDYFTVDLFDREGALLAAGEPLVYGNPLWSAVADERFPTVALIPWDLSGQATTVNRETLGRSVLLYLWGAEDLTAAMAEEVEADG